MPKIQNLFEQFIKCKRIEGQSPVTLRNYREHFDLLLKFKPDLKLSDLTEKTIVDFFEYRNNRKRLIGKEMKVKELKNSTKATVIGKLSSFFTWLVKRKYIKANPFEKFSYPNVEYTDKRALTSEEVDKIINTISTKIRWSNLLLKKRNTTLITFLLLTGVRKGELLGLELSDIDWKSKKVTVRGETSKSKETRRIPVTFELAQCLEDYLKEREDYKTEFLWVSSTDDRKLTEHGIKHFIEQLKSKTEINCHLHRFRHTFAINYYEQTNDIIGLKKLLGHKSLKMTLSYLRSLDDEHLNNQMKDFSLAKFK